MAKVAWVAMELACKFHSNGRRLVFGSLALIFGKRTNIRYTPQVLRNPKYAPVQIEIMRFFALF